MRQCLTSPDGGYYTSGGVEGNDIFGRKGDFITSPEISQIFGELLAVWTVTEWIGQGKRGSGVQLIEVGPGRGTLMADMLRVLPPLRRIYEYDANMLFSPSATSRALLRAWRPCTWLRPVTRSAKPRGDYYVARRRWKK